MRWGTSCTRTASGHKHKKLKQVVAKDVKPDHRQLAQQSMHSLVLSQSRYRCTVCFNSFHVSDPSCTAWLQGVCIKSGDDDLQPVRLNDVFHIGNQVTHYSHELYRFKSKIYCKRCGCYAGRKRLVSLARPCVPSADGAKIVHDIDKVARI